MIREDLIPLFNALIKENQEEILNHKSKITEHNNAIEMLSKRIMVLEEAKDFHMVRVL
jgi:hypothetical protein